MKNFLTFIFTFILVSAYGQDSPGEYTVKNASINTQSSDFGTAFFGNNKVVFASPKQGFTLNREETTNQPFLDLYIGEVTEDGQIIKKQKLQGDINSKYHEGMVSFTKDMKTVYFSANNYVKKKKNTTKVKSTKFIQLFRASISEDGEWTNLVLLPFNGDKFSSGHPVLNRDDSQLYFVSDRPESIGRTDLFVVDIYEDGSYSNPRNLGPKINTKDREMFPFIGKDNVLYFSSDGYPGYGELDVFASKIFDSTVSEPINLEEPVNSEFDDFAYIIDDHKHRGYFSSNRGGGHGDDDIYSFIASPPIYIECQQEISGVVRDIQTQNLVPDVMIVLYDAKGLELQSFISSKEEGAFDFQQPCNTTYTIKGYLEGHLVGELDIETVNDLNAEPIEITLNLNLDDYKQEQIIADTDLQTQQNMQPESMATAITDESAVVSSYDNSEVIKRESDKTISEDQIESAVALQEVNTGVDSTDQISLSEVNAVTSTTIVAQQVDNDGTAYEPKENSQITEQNATMEAVNSPATASVPSAASEVGSVNTIAVINSQVNEEVENSNAKVNTGSTDLNSNIQTENSLAAATTTTSASTTNTTATASTHAVTSQTAGAEEVSAIGTLAAVSEVNKVAEADATASEIDEKQTQKNTEFVSSNVTQSNQGTDSNQPEMLANNMPESSSENLDCLQEISGVVRDSNTEELIPNVLVILYDVKGKEIQSFMSDSKDASFTFEESCDTPYTIKTYVDGYKTGEFNISTSNNVDTGPIEIALTLDSSSMEESETIVSSNSLEEISSQNIGTKTSDGIASNSNKETNTDLTQANRSNIAINTSEVENESLNHTNSVVPSNSESDLIHINTIYFDYDKNDIRFDAKIELEKIAVVLKQNPESKLKVNSHADIRGKEAYNLTLSKNRARSTVQYLVGQGIELGRISGKGHGESQVVEICTKQNPCSGLQHQLNRRSEFLIVDNISDIIIAKSVNKTRSGNYAVSEMAPNSGVYLNYDFSDDREVYTVQIGAFKGKLQNEKYKKLTNLFNYKYEDGLNRYYAGIFESSLAARSYLKKMKKEGFEDAFVVGLKGTNRF